MNRVPLSLLRGYLSYDPIQKIWWDRKKGVEIETKRIGGRVYVPVHEWVFPADALERFYMKGQWEKRRTLSTHSGKGVDFHKPSSRWRARIRYKGRQKTLGYFHTETEAINCVTIARFKLKMTGGL